MTQRLLKRLRSGPWRLSRLRLPRDTVAELARDPRVRARVRDCASPRCPLYPMRPWQKSKGSTGYTDGDDDDE